MVEYAQCLTQVIQSQDAEGRKGDDLFWWWDGVQVLADKTCIPQMHAAIAAEGSDARWQTHQAVIKQHADQIFRAERETAMTPEEAQTKSSAKADDDELEDEARPSARRFTVIIPPGGDKE